MLSELYHNYNYHCYRHYYFCCYCYFCHFNCYNWQLDSTSVPKHTHCKVCTCKFCRNSAKFALQSLQMQSGQTLHLFVLKSMEKASLIFTGKSCVLTCANCKNCNLRKLCACGTNSLHVLSGACVLHFPKSKLRILSQDAIPLLKSLKFLQLSLGDSLDSLKPPLQAPLKPP